MSTMKPIQATPELSGKDAVKVLKQVNIKESEESKKRNNLLSIILKDIRK